MLHVNIPVNSTATIYLPAGKAYRIKESGKTFPASKINIAGGQTIIETGSGEYWFQLD
jgi:hypothetical protein